MLHVHLFRFSLSAMLLLWTVNANDCPKSFECGNLGNISFPFTTAARKECGALAIHGCDHNQQYHYIIIGSNKFNVTKIEQILGWPTVYVIDKHLRILLNSNSCKAFDHNITVPPPSPLGSFSVSNNITLFKCNRSSVKVTTPKTFLSYTSCEYNIFFGPPTNVDAPPGSMPACPTVQLPAVFGLAISANPFAFLTPEIPFHFTPSDDCAHCQDPPQDGSPCPRCSLDSNGKFFCAKRKHWSLASRYQGLILGLGIVACIILLLILTILLYKRKHGPAHVQLQSTTAFAASRNSDHAHTDRIFFGVPIFSYEELQEATNNFDCNRKLGEGGFGSVYYGKLVDGREVAVKHLFDHNYKRVEQFMNEIKILTRLRHRNLVSLYGCTSRDSRELLLVYEYIPNGTVASHIRGDLSRAGFLAWPIRMQIAIETATALAYLHASDIIHRDVKTNNILLDINFSVKVADFGLSRLFPNDATHVSTAPQGSPGYLDPEYFHCYQLTAKSDVYSFGVVLMELISSLPAVDATRERDEIN